MNLMTSFIAILTHVYLHRFNNIIHITCSLVVVSSQTLILRCQILTKARNFPEFGINEVPFCLKVLIFCNNLIDDRDGVFLVNFGEELA